MLALVDFGRTRGSAHSSCLEAGFCIPRSEDVVSGQPGPFRGKSMARKDDYLVLRFGFSSSRRHSEAVELAQSIPGYRCDSRPEGSQHQVLFSSQHAFEFLDLLLITKGWKNTVLLAPEGDIAPGRVSRALKCYWQRENNLKDRNYATGRDYCFGIHSDSCGRRWDSELRNDLGCRLSGFGCEDRGRWAEIMRETPAGLDVDRSRLRLKLEETLRELRFCPALDLDSLLEHVMRCPLEELTRPQYFTAFGSALVHKSADRTLAAYDTAIALFPESPEGHLAKARYCESKSPERADTAYDTAIAASPDRHEAYVAKAEHLRREGDYAGAAQLFSLALERLTPEVPADLGPCVELRRQKAHCLSQLRLFEEALQDYQWIQSHVTRRAMIARGLLLRIGGCYEALGQLDTASRVYSGQIEASESNNQDRIYALKHRAQLRVSQGDYRLAADDYECASSLVDDSHLSREYVYPLLLAQLKCLVSVPDFRAVLALCNQLVEQRNAFHFQRAVAHYCLGDYKSALDDIRSMDDSEFEDETWGREGLQHLICARLSAKPVSRHVLPSAEFYCEVQGLGTKDWAPNGSFEAVGVGLVNLKQALEVVRVLPPVPEDLLDESEEFCPPNAIFQTHDHAKLVIAIGTTISWADSDRYYVVGTDRLDFSLQLGAVQWGPEGAIVTGGIPYDQFEAEQLFVLAAAASLDTP